MTRIGKTFRDLRNRETKALTLFLTAGYPHRDSARTLVPLLADAGADMIELGMPFSDPLADGPVIQESSTIALRNGMTLRQVLEDAEFVRSHTSIPLLLMGYLNPILRYGVDRFARDAASSGIDGIILPEVPLEETERISLEFTTNSLDHILLVTPTTSPARVRAIDAKSSGFVYCVSMTGVTGRKASVGTGYLTTVRGLVTRNPLQIGFGIAGPDDARSVAAYADGVIVGTALIRKLKEEESLERVLQWVTSLKRALQP